MVPLWGYMVDRTVLGVIIGGLFTAIPTLINSIVQFFMQRMTLDRANKSDAERYQREQASLEKMKQEAANIERMGKILESYSNSVYWLVLIEGLILTGKHRSDHDTDRKAFRESLGEATKWVGVLINYIRIENDIAQAIQMTDLLKNFSREFNNLEKIEALKMYIIESRLHLLEGSNTSAAVTTTKGNNSP